MVKHLGEIVTGGILLASLATCGVFTIHPSRIFSSGNVEEVASFTYMSQPFEVIREGINLGRDKHWIEAENAKIFRANFVSDDGETIILISPYYVTVTDSDGETIYKYGKR